MNNVQKLQLLFDHFYRVIPANSFEEAKELLNIFPSSEYRKSDTNYGFWEGVYINAKSGAYIEFIREDDYWKKHFVSMCTSQYGDEVNLNQNIRELNPGLNYSISEINRPTGEPWMFTTTVENFNEKVYFYSIEYRELERQKRKEKGKANDNWLLTVDSLESCAKESQFEVIEKTAEWFSKEVLISKEYISIIIPQIDGSDFSIKILKTSEDETKRPFKITGKYDESKFNYKIKKNVQDFNLNFDNGVYHIEMFG